jgi:hypothetical protein
MGASLRKQDIIFSQTQTTSRSPIDVEYPYILKLFPKGRGHGMVATVAEDFCGLGISTRNGNYSLLHLGILLLELYTGRPFEPDHPGLDASSSEMEREMILYGAAHE